MSMLHHRDATFINHGWTRINADNHFAGWRSAPWLLNKRMRAAPFQPKNQTPLQIIKERVLTDFGGAAKMDSNRNLTVFVPVRAFSSAVRPLGGHQRAPKATKSHRILNFQPVAHPKLYQTFTFSLPKFMFQELYHILSIFWCFNEGLAPVRLPDVT
jgi:hypothetical protein